MATCNATSDSRRLFTPDGGTALICLIEVNKVRCPGHKCVSYREIATMIEGEDDYDVTMMKRCIALAKSSADAGEYPFAAIIARNGDFVSESINRTRQNHNAISHAEILALAQAQLIAGGYLADCTIYTTVEPCALCSYAIREARIGKVVYGLRSPLMGGHTRWNILSEKVLSDVLPEVFMPAPTILSGFLQDDVEAVFRAWNPLIWQVIKSRGVFVSGVSERADAQEQTPHRFIARLIAATRSLLIHRRRKA